MTPAAKGPSEAVDGTAGDDQSVTLRAREWVRAWIVTLRVAPPFSARRRRLIARAREPFDLADYIELERPE